MSDKWYTRALLWCLFAPILAALKVLTWVVGDLEAAARMIGIEKEEEGSGDAGIDKIA